MLTIDYFSDVLCVWAYGGQIRLDELRGKFGDRIRVRERFMPLFADTQTKIGEGWADRGGYAGFGQHAQDVSEQWDHITINPSIWRDCRPTTCINAHVFLKALALALRIEEDAPSEAPHARFHEMTATVRNAFFGDGRDISRFDELFALLSADDPAPDRIREQIENGAAAAAMHRDTELASRFGVRGSPTYVFNDGRQMLFGNVGYKIIEANIAELLSGSITDGEPSWC